MGIIAVFAIGATLFFMGLVRFSGSTESSDKIECDGFSSPEAAVEDYLYAFKTKDLDRMISCYAIESYAENYNAQKAIEGTKCFLVSTTSQWPDLGLLSQEINVKNREMSVYSHIIYQYETLCTSNADEGTNVYKLNDYSDYEDFLSSFSPNKEDNLDKMTCGNTLLWEQIAEVSMTKDEYTEKIASSSYCDDAVCDSVFATLSIGEKNYILAMDTIQINGKWYLYRPSYAIETINNCGLTEE